MARTRTAARTEFLSDVLTTALEGGIQYWGGVTDYYSTPEVKATVWVDLDEDDDEPTEYAVTIDTIAKGIRILTTGENKGKAFTMSGEDYWKQFLLANRTNGVDGDYDADIADNVLQAGIFGEVVYG